MADSALVDLEVALAGSADWLRRVERAGYKCHTEGLVDNEALNAQVTRAVEVAEDMIHELRELRRTLKDLG